MRLKQRNDQRVTELSDNKDNQDRPKTNYVGVGMAIGSGMGVSLGAAFGAAFGNVGMGVAFGVVFGTAFGLIIGIVLSGSDSKRGDV